MFKNSKIVVILAIVFFCFSTLSAFLSFVYPNVSISNRKSDFSVSNAVDHVEQIAKYPHSSGTPQHQDVIDYIVNFCQKHDFEVVIQDDVGIRSYPGLVISGQVKNIIVTVKGSLPGRSILVVGHFDSQSNTPGAADNGSTVAAMMETIRILRGSPALRNDVIFLFSDLEEAGLLGTELFRKRYAQSLNIGLLLNYDARGNAGASVTFQTFEKNGWVIREYSKAAKYPIANSFLSDLYLLMPHETDFSAFQGMGIVGLNSAFADGYPYYHSMTDTPENLSQESLEMQGNNMLSLVRHFGNLDLSNNMSNDVVFFNVLTHKLIVYSADWESVYIIISVVLYCLILLLGVVKKRFRIKHLLIGFFLFLASIFFANLLGFLLQKTVLIAYPYYSNFYSSSFYNYKYYLLSFLGTTLLSFSLLFRWSIRSLPFESIFAGGFGLLVLFTVFLKIYFPAGAYILYLPLLFVEVLFLLLLVKNITAQSNPIAYNALYWISITPAFVLWSPLIYFTYILFGFSNFFGAVILMTFTFPFLILLLRQANLYKNILPLFTSASLIIAGILLGHLNSKYTLKEPLLTNLMYASDLDEKKSFWVSESHKLDEWNRQYIHSRSKEPFNELYPEWNWMVWKDNAPDLENIEAGTITKLQDTVVSEERIVKILVSAASTTNSLDVWFPTSTNILKIGDRIVDANNSLSDSYTRLKFYSPSPSGLLIEFSTTSSEDILLKFIERQIGIPKPLLLYNLPRNIQNGPGEISNSVQIKQIIKFSNDELSKDNY